MCVIKGKSRKHLESLNSKQAITLLLFMGLTHEVIRQVPFC